MSFDDKIDELTKQIQDTEGTMYRKIFVSSTPKDKGVLPKDVFITINDSGLGSKGSSLSRQGRYKKKVIYQHTPTRILTILSNVYTLIQRKGKHCCYL